LITSRAVVRKYRITSIDCCKRVAPLTKKEETFLQYCTSEETKGKTKYKKKVIVLKPIGASSSK
jgi:hypothetical protein